MPGADELKAQLESYTSAQLGVATTIEDMNRMSGGASREIWSFTVLAQDGAKRLLQDGAKRLLPDGLTTPMRLVLRRDPVGAPPKTDRGNEVTLLRAAEAAGVPVPHVVWVGDGDELGSPGFVMEHVDGETIARKILRDDEFGNARDVMAGQIGQIAANIHAIDTDGLGLTPLEASAAETIHAQYSQLLQSMGEPHPVFELGLRWLARSMPASDRTTVVHGDFRNGNFIVGPEGIRAVLDWELVHMGDPWEDLAWVCTRSWRFGGAGEVGGFGDREELYAAYEKTSGLPVDRHAVDWWEVMSSVKWGIMTIGQAFTHLWGHVKSLELAAIGRRTVETEYDVLRLLKERA